MRDYDEILHYWFGRGATNADIIDDKTSLWWGKNEAVDREIRQRFGRPHGHLLDGELEAWKAEARGRLAMIILADQFPRNMFRDTPRAFASDDLAVALSLEGIDTGGDRQLTRVERVFFYMPLMHAESPGLQDQSVELFRGLVQEADREEREKLQINLDFAIRHRDIIRRFGRFPHRNRILGRESTTEEREFLKEPGSSF